MLMKPGGVRDEEEDEDDFATLMPNLASLAFEDVDEFGDSGETEIVNSDGDDCSDTGRTEIVLPAASPTVPVEPLRATVEPLFSATYARRRKVARKGASLGGAERARKSLYAGRAGDGGKKALPQGEHSFLEFAEAGQRNVLQEVQNFFDRREKNNQQRQRKVKVRSRRSLTRTKRKSAGNFQICLDADENEVAGWDEEKLVEEDDRQEFCFQSLICGERETSSLPFNSFIQNAEDVHLGRRFGADRPEQCDDPVPGAREAGDCEATGGIFERLDGLGSDVDMALCFGKPFDVEYSILGKRMSADLLDSNAIVFSPAEDVQVVEEIPVHFGNIDDVPLAAEVRPEAEGLQVPVGDSMHISMTLPPAVYMPELEVHASGEESGGSSGGHGDGFHLPTDNEMDSPTTFAPSEGMLGLQGSEYEIADSTDLHVTLPSAVDMPEVEELQPEQGPGDESEVNAPHAEPGVTPLYRDGQVDTLPPEGPTLDSTDVHVTLPSAVDMPEVEEVQAEQGAGDENEVNAPHAEPGVTPLYRDSQVDILPPEGPTLDAPPPPAEKPSDLQDVPDGHTSCNHNHVDKQSQASSEHQSGRSKSKRKRRRMEVDRRKSLLGAGTKWEDGLRRSTRIRVPPVEWWNNEKLLYGRVSNTLCTLVGIKKLLPTTPPVGRRQKESPQKFEITSFVSPRWKNLVEFVAL